MSSQTRDFESAPTVALGLTFEERHYTVYELVQVLEGVTALIHWANDSESFDTRYEAPVEVHVTRLSLASPLEIMVAISGAGVSAAVLADRLIAVFRNFSATRTQFAKDRFDHLRYDLAREALSNTLDHRDFALTEKVAATIGNVTVADITASRTIVDLRE